MVLTMQITMKDCMGNIIATGIMKSVKCEANEVTYEIRPGYLVKKPNGRPFSDSASPI